MQLLRSPNLITCLKSIFLPPAVASNPLICSFVLFLNSLQSSSVYSPRYLVYSMSISSTLTTLILYLPFFPQIQPCIQSPPQKRYHRLLLPKLYHFLGNRLRRVVRHHCRDFYRKALRRLPAPSQKTCATVLSRLLFPSLPF